MSSELFFLLSLGAKMAITAAFVVAAAAIAERTNPTVAALVSTLPVAAGPTYVFLALDHDRAFLAASALASLTINAATGIFALVYAQLAQRQPLWVALPGALAVWLAVALAIRTLPSLAVWETVAFNAVVFCACIAASRRYLNVKMPPAIRRWYDVPLRAGLVALMVAIVVGLSSIVGPTLTGVLAVFPAVLTCLMLILHDRIGGRASAAVLASTQVGLIGFSVCVLSFYLMASATRLTIWWCLALALVVAVAFNLATFVVSRAVRRRRAASAT